MKNSGLLKWANNKNNKSKGGNSNKNWIHPAEALQGGHVVYLVKFLGSNEVSRPKGIEVIKETIQKLRFSEHIKKSEGTKIAKVELTISIDGVAIQHPKSKKIIHQYPLHRISYCADDKAEKRFFSFIAKEGDSESHTCFVFISDKLSEEITLTIGQAFDLAYKRFLDSSTKESDIRQQFNKLQLQLKETKEKNSLLVQKLQEALQCKDIRQLEGLAKDGQLSRILNDDDELSSSFDSDGKIDDRNLIVTTPTLHLPPVPPRNDLVLIHDLLTPNPPVDHSDDSDFDPRADERSGDARMSPPTNSEDDDFDPRAEEKKSVTPFHINRPILNFNGTTKPAPLPPPPSKNNNFVSHEHDPFKVNNKLSDDLLTNFDEMQLGFTRGLSFGSTEMEFNIDSLDPLKN